MQSATEEGSATPGQFTISRTGDTTDSLTVYLFVIGTADSDDYSSPIPDSVTIPAGSATVTLDVLAVDDDLVEGTEMIEVGLAWSPDYLLSGIEQTNSAAVTILDNDPGVLIGESFDGGSEVATYETVVEEGGYDTYTVVLAAPPTADVTVTAVAGAGLLLSSGSQPTPSAMLTLTFTPEDWDVPQVVTASAGDNGVAEGPREVTVTHSVASADPRYAGLVATLNAQVKDKEQPDPKKTAQYWKDQAAKRIDIGNRGATEIEKVALRNVRINAAYAELFRDNFDRFLWMGAAAYASKKVGEGLWNAKKVQDSFGLAGKPIVDVGLKLGAGNKAVYDDLYWQHLTFANPPQGMNGFQFLQSFGNAVKPEQLAAWKEIQEGIDQSNADKIFAGNMKLLRYEQEQILQPTTFAQLGKLTRDTLSVVTPSPIPEGKSFFEYHATLFNFDPKIERFADRWAWIANAVMQDWRAYRANNAEAVKKFLQQLIAHDKREFGGG